KSLPYIVLSQIIPVVITVIVLHCSSTHFNRGESYIRQTKTQRVVAKVMEFFRNMESSRSAFSSPSATPPRTSDQWKPSTKRGIRGLRHMYHHRRYRKYHIRQEISKLRSLIDASAPHRSIFVHSTDHQIRKLRSLLDPEPSILVSFIIQRADQLRSILGTDRRLVDAPAVAEKGDASSWGPGMIKKTSPNPRDGSSIVRAHTFEFALVPYKVPTSTQTNQPLVNNLTMPPTTTTSDFTSNSGRETPSSAIVPRIYGPVMPRPGQPGALHFDNTNVSEFLRRWNIECEDFGLTDAQKCARIPDYCTSETKDVVELLDGYKMNDWTKLQSEL